MSEPKTFTGGCHCGAVRYRVTMALEGAIACNCSICQKTGTVLAFAPAEQFELLSGADALADYQFGKRRIHHLFCTRCGVRSFTRGPTKVSINVRCLDGVDLKAVPTKEFDGKSLPLE
jgi:hypothetical protein